MTSGYLLTSCGNNISPTSSSRPTATSTPANTPVINTPTPTPNVTVIANYGASSEPWNLHFDNAGNLYVAFDNASGPCTVVKIASPGTSPVTSLAYAGTAAINESAAVMDPNGNLWIAPQSNKVIEIPAGGGTPVTITAGFYSGSSVIDMAINNAGTTLYMDDGISTYLYALNLSNPSAGAVTLVNKSDNPQGFGQGLAFDSNGDLFLGGAGYVGEILAASLNPLAIPFNFAGNGSNGCVNGTLTGTSEFTAIYGVAVDSSGNVYATDVSSLGIRKISGGQVTTLVARTGSSLNPTVFISSIGASDYLPGVACDNAGNVYFTDYTNGNIYRYQP